MNSWQIALSGWSELWFYFRSGLEIIIIWTVLYLLLRALERISAGGKMRGLAVGIGMLVAAWLAARFFELHAISWLLQASLGLVAVVLVVVLQPELRRLFSRLGGVVPGLDSGIIGTEATISSLVEAAVALSTKRIGGLIVLERGDRLDDLIASGQLDCDLSSRSLLMVFWKDSPFHDGAVIISRGRIAGAGVILPLTGNPAFANLSGTRHRAAVGISEETDALALIISEETGTISIADRGVLTTDLTARTLEELLHRLVRTNVDARRTRTSLSPVTAAYRKTKSK